MGAIVEATRSGVVIHDRDALIALRSEFDRQHVVRLPRFLAPPLLATVQTFIAEGTFVSREDKGIAVELTLEPNRAIALMLFAMNAPPLAEALEIVTGA